MRVDRQHIGIHSAWGLFAGSILASMAIWYTVACLRAGELLHGGSLPSLVCGISAGMIILFEMLLAPRKWLRGRRLIPAKHWMAAHLWLGLASWPLAIIHCGFHLGGGLPTTFMVVFSLTIFSGIYGWVLQNIIPKLLFKRVRSETIYSQIDSVSQRNYAEVESMLLRNFGLPPNDSLSSAGVQLRERHHRSRQGSLVVVGAVRGSSLRASNGPMNTVQASPQDSERLWHALTSVKDYMLRGKRSGSEIAIESYANRFFSNLRKACDPSSLQMVDALEEFCIQRREFDIQQNLHRWLHSWLPVHIGLSVAVTVLLVVHVITAIRYW